MISVKKRKSDRDVVFAFFDDDEDDALVCNVCFEPLLITSGGTKLVCLECSREE